jgi:putative hydrolase of the HAD superfamily
LNTIKAIIFDWRDTVMRDFPEYQGPMADWPRVEMVDGVDKALNSLSKQYICCLASNANNSNAELVGKALERVNLRQYFRFLFTSNELGVKKPDPGFFREILKSLELKPEQCVAVGNDYQKDIVPAKSSGMRTVWFAVYPGTIPAPAADFTIASMSKLPLTLKIIIGKA